MEIKFDKRNYRKHSDSNKRKIKKSLQECGAGRSVLVDADDTLIAGNGVFEQAQAMGIPTRVIETDGTEIELSYNFAGRGFMCNPCLGIKWKL